jgi:hypothetical protein
MPHWIKYNAAKERLRQTYKPDEEQLAKPKEENHGKKYSLRATLINFLGKRLGLAGLEEL